MPNNKGQKMVHEYSIQETLARTAKWKDSDRRALAILAQAWFLVKADRSLDTPQANAITDRINHAQDYVDQQRGFFERTLGPMSRD